MLTPRAFLLLLILAFGELARGEELPVSARFEPTPAEPIFTSAPGQWDTAIRERGWIMKDGDLWKMWYTGYQPDQLPLQMKLGYATSPDGIAWTRSTMNPLIDHFWAEDVMVVKHEGRYLMFAEGAGDQAQLLESPDGLQWTRIGTLDVRLTNGQPIPPGPFGTPTAFFENGTWNLFYERSDKGIWLARSKDLKVWTNVSDDPVIGCGPNEWDSLMIAMNQVIKIDGRYLAVLHGTGTPQKPRQWNTTFAESTDLIHWKKLGPPVRPISENKSSGLLLNNGQTWRLYTMHHQVHLHTIK